MKKKSLKSLKLNKRSISKLQLNQTKGGTITNGTLTPLFSFIMCTIECTGNCPLQTEQESCNPAHCKVDPIGDDEETVIR